MFVSLYHHGRYGSSEIGPFGLTRYGIDNGNARANHQVVAIAKTLNGRPVKLLWTREEDWGFGVRPRPMGVATVKAAVDAAGYPIAVEVHTAGENYGGAQQWRGLTAWPYYAPNYRYTTHVPRTHVPVNLRRATGSSTNCFYLESFIDELAHAAGKDPYQYRRELIARNPTDKPGIGGFTPAQRGDWLRTLDLAAKMSGWGTPLPEGWARGIAIDDRRRPSRNSTTACAEVHTVSVSRRGQVRLHRVDVAFDQGFSFVNPLTARKQIEGMMAWGWDAMYQATTIKDGRNIETNFDTLTVSRMNEYPPEVNIQFIKTNHWLYGLGEEAIQQVAPAIANAVFEVTGKRIRSLPLKNHDLSWSWPPHTATKLDRVGRAPAAAFTTAGAFNIWQKNVGLLCSDQRPVAGALGAGSNTSGTENVITPFRRMSET